MNKIFEECTDKADKRERICRDVYCLYAARLDQSVVSDVNG